MVTLFSTGCTSPKTLVILSDNGARYNEIIITTDKGRTKLDRVGSYVNLSKESRPSEVKMMSMSEIRRRFNNLFSVTPKKARSYIVYFKPNSLELTDRSKVLFAKALKTIRRRSPCIVDVIGHTDTVGGFNANLKTSLKRANYIKSAILKKGIRVISIIAKGYGERELLVKTKDNVPETKNRNVEIFIK
jgi:outer membrane protein OmpA-like peptidoglycan-associated protein